ncbi:AAA-type ATPase, N-terminal domain [Dillenia turbinata]|uniref:AAA-type ATPase, N-terminal domain n=1 Tax=Dillenia turbinata TaxID=194707 RepID=A0AAN8ZH15_9MAGN
MEILSQMWSFLGLLTVLQNVLPAQLLSLLHSLYESLQDLFSPYSYFEIPEFNGYCGVDINDLYRHVNLYLNSVNSSPSAKCRRLTLSRSKSSKRISFTVAPNHSVHDSFNGHRVSWTHHVDTVQDSLEEKRSFSLKLPKRHRHALLSPYLEYVTSQAEEFERVSRERLDDHPMFDVVDSCIRYGGALTPAQIGEILLRNRRDVDNAVKAVVSAMQARIQSSHAHETIAADGDHRFRYCTSGNNHGDLTKENEDSATTPESIGRLLLESPENWECSPEKYTGKKRKDSTSTSTSTWEKRVKFLTRLKSLTKSDSGRRGI